MSLWLLVAVMAAATTAGVFAERRWHDGAVRASGTGMGWALQWVLPPVYLVLVSRLDVDLRLLSGLAAGYVVLATVGLLAWFVASRVLQLPRRTVGAVILAVILGNTTYFGLPLVQAVLGEDELGSAVAWDSLVSGPMFYVAAFAVGAAFSAGGAGGPDSVHAGEVEAESRLGAFLRNPLLWASVAGLVLPFDAPDWSAEIAHVAVVAMLPAGFLVVGIRLSAEGGDGDALAGGATSRARGWWTPELATIVALRLVVGPLLIVGLSVALLDLPSGMLLQAVAPTGINGMLVAHRFNLDLRPIASAIVVTTVLVTAGAITVSLVG